MTTDKNKPLLDTNYYSAYEYEEEKVSKPPYIQILFAITIIVVAILAYGYFVTNSIEKVEPIYLAKEKKVMSIEKELLPSKVVKVEAKKELLSTPVKNDVLSDEYIKLVQESMGNY